jgi:ribonuclease HI
MINIYFDGGTSGNRICISGETAQSAVVKKLNPDISFTNNQLEYYALIEALRYIKKLYSGELHEEDRLRKVHDICIKGDSQLVIKHIRGEFEVKSEKLIDLNHQIKGLMGEIGFFPSNLIWVPREQNIAGKILEN